MQGIQRRGLARKFIFDPVWAPARFRPGLRAPTGQTRLLAGTQLTSPAANALLVEYTCQAAGRSDPDFMSRSSREPIPEFGSKSTTEFFYGPALAKQRVPCPSQPPHTHSEYMSVHGMRRRRSGSKIHFRPSVGPQRGFGQSCGHRPAETDSWPGRN